jgi:hypothetical protein
MNKYFTLVFFQQDFIILKYTKLFLYYSMSLLLCSYIINGYLYNYVVVSTYKETWDLIVFI